MNKNGILSGNLASTTLSKVPIFVPHNPKAVPKTIVTVVRVFTKQARVELTEHAASYRNKKELKSNFAWYLGD